jgi:hypothetical protein
MSIGCAMSGMNVHESQHSIKGGAELYIETAPLIYYVETNPAHIARMDAIVSAVDAGCDTFLTNDAHIRWVREIPVLILDELQPDPNAI